MGTSRSGRGPARRWPWSVALVVVVAVGVGVLAGPAGPAGAVAGFRDVPAGAFFTAPVQWANDEGITTGIDGTAWFAPSMTTTRAQLVTFLWRSAGRPRAPDAPRFADQRPGAFYDAAVRWARAAGITTGVDGTNRFQPDRAVTRAEAVTLLWRAAGRPASPAGARFADQRPGAFYDAAVRWARATGITTGVDGSNRFQPSGPVSRAQSVTFLYRLAGSPRVVIDPNPPYEPPRPAGPTVYLTFDDGPDATWTPAVLDLLAAHGARATFFPIGQAVQARPDLAARAAREGHRVENHTHTHPWLTGLSDASIRSQLRAANQAIASATGRRPTCLRPPGGFLDDRVRRVAAEEGLRIMMWDVDPWDWRRPGAGTIAARVLREVRPGAVILLHDGGGNRAQTVDALRTILPELRARGYQFGLPCG